MTIILILNIKMTVTILMEHLLQFHILDTVRTFSLYSMSFEIKMECNHKRLSSHLVQEVFVHVQRGLLGVFRR